MRKLSVIYLFLISILSFTLILSICVDNSFSDIYAFSQTVSDSSNKETLTVIMKVKSEKEYEHLSERIKEYAIHNKVNIIYNGSHSDSLGRSYVDYYMFIVDEEILSNLNLKKDKKLTFKEKKESGYYTTNLDDKKAVNYINIFSSKFKSDTLTYITFQNISEMFKDKRYMIYGNVTLNFICESKDTEFLKFKKYLDLDNNFDELNIEEIEVHSSWKEINDNDMNEVFRIIWISVFILFLSIFFELNNKKINELSQIDKYKKVILRFSNTIFIFILIQIFLYVLFVDNSNVVNSEFNSKFFKLLLSFSLFGVITLIASLLKVKFQKASESISSFDLKVIYFKIIAILLSISSYYVLVSQPNYIDKFWYILENKNLISESYSLQNLGFDGYLVGDRLINNKSVSYADFSFIEYPEIFYSDNDIDKEPLIFANKTYLKNYRFYGEGGKELNINSLKDGDILMPVNRKAVNFNFSTTGEIIYIKEGNKLQNLNINDNMLFVMDPIIQYVNKIPDVLRDGYNQYFNLSKDKKISTYKKDIEAITSNDSYLVLDRNIEIDKFLRLGSNSLSKILLLTVGVLLLLITTNKLCFQKSEKSRFYFFDYDSIFLNILIYIIPLSISLLILKYPLYFLTKYYILLISTDIIISILRKIINRKRGSI